MAENVQKSACFLATIENISSVAFYSQCVRTKKIWQQRKRKWSPRKLHAALLAVAAGLGVRPAAVPQCFCLIALSIRSSFRTGLSPFLYETPVFLLSVQDSAFFCTKCLFMLDSSRFGPSTCSFLRNRVVPSRFAPSTCSFSNNPVDWCRIEPFSVRNDRLSTISLNGWIEMERKICKCWKSATYRFGLYPEPGSNRHASRHWCLRPARLPIPPSGH